MREKGERVRERGKGCATLGKGAANSEINIIWELLGKLRSSGLHIGSRVQNAHGPQPSQGGLDRIQGWIVPRHHAVDLAYAEPIHPVSRGWGLQERQPGGAGSPCTPMRKHKLIIVYEDITPWQTGDLHDVRG